MAYPYYPTYSANPYMAPQMASPGPVAPGGSFVGQNIQSAPVASQTANSPIIWVQGEAAAKSYPCAPGNTVLLMDSEASAFYLKSSDQSGMPLPLRVFDYTERKAVPGPSAAPVAASAASVDMGDYVTHDELEGRLKAVLEAVSEKKAKKGAGEDE